MKANFWTMKLAVNPVAFLNKGAIGAPETPMTHLFLALAFTPSPLVLVFEEHGIFWYPVGSFHHPSSFSNYTGISAFVSRASPHIRDRAGC